MIRTSLGILSLFILFAPSTAPAEPPAKDTRADLLRDPDHYELRLPPVQSLAQWEARKSFLREMVLLRAGLWPEPERTPLNARVFDERKGEGFTVAKVYFESLPGFLVTGNLYRPAKGTPPYPAVITPHGHWQYGRLQNSVDGSIPGRCIDFARMGFVVFAPDMVGFNDSMQFPHNQYSSRDRMNADSPVPFDKRVFEADFSFPEAELYGFSLGGLQLWNNIRGVDFLASLPEVDPRRIGATGASGGATQTILLMVADDRIRCAAPVNIIGAAKHPGCRCENFNSLWLDTSTVELAASFAPRPLLLMSATEDPWTDKTPEREYPIIRKYYELYGAVDKLKNVQIKAGHNYNAQTRAAVYDWFCAHLHAPFPPIANPVPVSAEVKALGDLRVFPDRALPGSALTAWDIMKNWKAQSEKAFEALLPNTPPDYEKFDRTFRNKLALALAAEIPGAGEIQSRQGDPKNLGAATFRTVTVGRSGKSDCFTLESLNAGNLSAGNVLVVSPASLGGIVNERMQTPEPWARDLLKRGHRVYRIRGYSNGEIAVPQKTYDSWSWTRAYNRDNRMNAIQDIVTAIEFIRTTYPNRPLTVVGLGDCGISTALACAVSGKADRVVADLDGHDPGYDGELLELLPYGAIRRVGDFRTAALLLMNKPLTILNAGATFDRAWYEKMAKAAGVETNLRFGTWSGMEQAAGVL
jgi:dienelactone hydrolase